MAPTRTGPTPMAPTRMAPPRTGPTRTARTPDTLDVLDLLSGDSQTFREKVWGSRIHLHHTDPAALVSRLSLDDADRLLTSSALRTPAVRVVQDGTVLPAAAYTRSATLAGAPMTGLLDGRKVLALFAGGATVVLQGLH